MRLVEVCEMPLKSNSRTIEERVEQLEAELEPKIVKEICKEFKLSSKHEKMSLHEIHYALGHHLGFIHLVERMKKRILRRDYGIRWKSPSELNPGFFYD